MSAAEDIEAINQFFHRADSAPKTAAARALLTDWVQWYDANKPGTFGWWSDEQSDVARNKRNAYNRANAVTAQEKAATERVITSGVSTEQAQGEADRRNADGNYVIPPPGAVHQWWFAPAIAAGVTATLLLVGPKLASIYLGKKL